MPNGRRAPGPRSPQVSDARLQEIILQGNAQTLNEEANVLGEYFASGGERDKLSSSQIRNVLDKLQRMKTFDQNQLQLLRPLLAYAAPAGSKDAGRCGARGQVVIRSQANRAPATGDFELGGERCCRLGQSKAAGKGQKNR